MEAHEPGALPFTYWTVTPGLDARNGAARDHAEPTDGGVIDEALLTIFVNAQELATIMCSPLDQEALALGFLYNEEVIESRSEVCVLQPNVVRTSIDIFLDRGDFVPPRRLTLTSGCSGGVSFQNLIASRPPLETPFTVTPQAILDRMRDLKSVSRLYNTVRGVHTSILADENGLLLSAEDVGRHNTIDKVAGKALLEKVETRDRLLLTSGRVSSEMLNKARRMGVPVVASHTSPTGLTLRLAEAWNICVIGYVRQGSMRVYTHPWRLGLPGDAARANSHLRQRMASSS